MSVPIWLGGGGAWDWDLEIWRWRVADLNMNLYTTCISILYTRPDYDFRTTMLSHLISETFPIPCCVQHEHLPRHVLSPCGPVTSKVE